MAPEEERREAVRVELEKSQQGEVVTPASSSRSEEKAPLNKYAFACAVLASMNSILLGYDIGVMSGAILFIKEDLRISSTQEEILVGSLNFFSLFGAMVSGKTADWIGRRYTMVIASTTFLVGALAMSLANSFVILMVGRAVAGIGVGYSLMTGPVYTAEVSPASTRGLLTSLPEVFITVGILVGYILNYAFSGLPEHLNWRLMLGVAGIPAAMLIIGLIAMPESPRWLVAQGRMGEAKKVLDRTSVDGEEAEARLAEIAAAARQESLEAGKKSVWRELLVSPSRAVRRILLVAIGLNIFMQASGNDAVVYYTPEVIKAAGIQKKQHLVAVTIIMGLVKTTFVIISALFLDRVGRRPLLLTGSCGMAASLFTLGVCSKLIEKAGKATKFTWTIGLSIVAICADVSFFSIGMGPINWVYSSEVFPLRLRAQGTGLALSVNRVVSGVVSMSFLSMVKALSVGGTFFLFSGIAALGALFFYMFLPETKGKTLEEIGSLFEDERGVIATDACCCRRPRTRESTHEQHDKDGVHP
ncbi:Polyol transporter 5 [Nymphaea thermarum]|nr:Polyol transporter 5 [Nymphaea thermarum]